MSKSNPAVENLRQGQTVYFVHALGEASFTYTLLVMSKPYLYKFAGTKESALAIDTRKFYEDRRFVPYDDNTFLADANVVKNTYNNHRLFFSRKKAETYLKWCKKNTKNRHNGMNIFHEVFEELDEELEKVQI